MPLYSFVDAKTHLKKRVGNRSDITDSEYGKYVNQAQQVMATNVKGLEPFDMLSAGKTIPPNTDNIAIASTLTLPTLWAIEGIRNQTTRQRMWRADWLELSRLPTPLPVGPLTRWVRRYGLLYFFSTSPTPTELFFYYRRVATPDVLEVPDEWFEHLLNLAAVFIYPTIGRNKERDDLFKKLPSQLQLGALNPLTATQWEALNDQNLGFYA